MGVPTYQGQVKLVLFDVDGILTDGSLTFNEEGEQTKTFNVRDGLAIALLHAHGILSGVISGRASAPLNYRIDQLKFDVAVTGQLEKREAYFTIKRDLQLEDTQIAYVGDDVVDLPLIGHVAHFYAPSDAHPLVLKRASHVVPSPGGRGVARDVAEHVLQSGGLSLEQAYRPLIDRWSQFNAVQ